MKQRPNLRPLLAAAATLAALLPISAARSETIYGLSNAGVGTLVRFDSATPGSVTQVGTVAGLTAGQTLVSMDFRPATGQLFGLGVNGTTGVAQLYTINLSTAAVLTVGGTFTVANPTATGWDIDFNPTVDRIRVLNSNGTSLRLNPDTGAVVATDTDVSAASVGAAGYSNNFGGAALTTLYGFDYNTNNLVTIGGLNGNPSPNGGTVNIIGNTGLSANDLDSIGFDIGRTGIAYLQTSVTGSNVDNLYTVNLSTGVVTLVGAFPANARDIAVLVPEPGTNVLLALGLCAGGYALLRRRRQQAA